MVIVYGAGGPGGPNRLPRSMPAEFCMPVVSLGYSLTS